jgi:flagellar biogenesis protein FliO
VKTGAMEQIALSHRSERGASHAGTSLRQTWLAFWSRAWRALQQAAKSQAATKKRLRICENVSLGDKRFVALLQVDDQRFLIGGAANSIAMLAQLSEPFSAALNSESQGPTPSS